VTPLVFLAASAGMLANAAALDPVPTFIGFGVIAAGVPAFYVWKAK
jgi:hypothetical protein